MGGGLMKGGCSKMSEEDPKYIAEEKEEGQTDYDHTLLGAMEAFRFELDKGRYVKIQIRDMEDNHIIKNILLRGIINWD
jgi:hypothetical protein